MNRYLSKGLARSRYRGLGRSLFAAPVYSHFPDVKEDVDPSRSKVRRFTVHILVGGRSADEELARIC
jgi:hypothetical protein